MFFFDFFSTFFVIFYLVFFLPFFCDLRLYFGYPRTFPRLRLKTPNLPPCVKPDEMFQAPQHPGFLPFRLRQSPPAPSFFTLIPSKPGFYIILPIYSRVRPDFAAASLLGLAQIPTPLATCSLRRVLFGIDSHILRGFSYTPTLLYPF